MLILTKFANLLMYLVNGLQCLKSNKNSVTDLFWDDSMLM